MGNGKCCGCKIQSIVDDGSGCCKLQIGTWELGFERWTYWNLEDGAPNQINSDYGCCDSSSMIGHDLWL